MTKIIFRMLIVLIIVVNAVIVLLSSICGINLYEKYGKHILLGISLFCGVIMAFYIALALLGIN